MEIFPLGHASFKIKSKSGVVLVTDPYDAAMLGMKFPKVERVDIVTVSHAHQDHNKVDALEGKPLVINGPGEYEVKGIPIVGVATFHDSQQGSDRGKNVVYNLAVDGVMVCHLGDLGHKLTEDQVSQIGRVDVLLLPVGGFYTLPVEQAYETVTQLEPKIVIPMHYKTPKHNPQIFGHLETVERFLRLAGGEQIPPQPKLVVTADKLPGSTSIILLENF